MSRGAAKRAYLPAAQRREELLTAAAEIVGRRGWAALTMKGLAEATGVSRQLVYGHFPDTASLMVATLHHLFDRSRQATEEILRQAPEGDVGSVVRNAYQIYLDLDPGPRRALRSLSGGDAEPPEMRRVQRVMRDDIIALWVPFIRRRTAFGERAARALAWMFVSAAWGLADLVEEGELSAATAKNLFASFADGSIAGDDPGALSKRRNRR
jgi:AcrR family transcriptional regulator